MALVEDEASTDAGRSSPRVFISYAHASPEHEEAVRDLWVFLRSQGIDARLDLPAAEQRREWPQWMIGEVRAAAFVLVIASPAYRERAERTAPPGEGLGVQFEAALILEELYRDRDTAVRKFLPVLLPGATTDDIPDFLGRISSTHYAVSELTVPGVDRLLRVLTGQPFEVNPPLGPLVDLPPRAGSAAPALPALRSPPSLAHELVLDVKLGDGRLRCRTTLAGTTIGEQDAPVPAGLGDVWRNLSSPAAPVRLVDAGRGLAAALLDDATVGHLVELLDRSLFGTVVDVVVEAEGPALALPYELLRLPGGRLLATVPGVRLRRRVRGIERSATPPLPGPLKILVAVGAPEETRTKNQPLDIEAEMQAILDALAGVEGSDAAQVTILEVGGPQEIADALRDDQYHVLHVSAHGSPSGLELEDEDGNPVAVDAAELVKALRAGGKPLPLVVLSSCAGGAGGSDGLAATLVASGADRVLAMQDSVTDRYATALSRELYDALAKQASMTAGAALAEGRSAVQTQAGAATRGGGEPWPPEYALPTLLSVGEDPPLVDPTAAPEPLSRPTIAPTGSGVRRLPVGYLIGRRAELRTAMAVLRGGQAAVDRYGAVSGVVLTGVGGIGKTALAGRIETRLAAEGWMPAVHFGRWNPSALTTAVVAALDAHARDPRLEQAKALLTQPDVDDSGNLHVVLQLLAQTKLLVLFDDFEQNLQITDDEVTFRDPGFAELFEQLCEAADTGRLLVTSRYPVPDAETVLQRVHVPSLSPAELRRMLIRLPALRNLAGEDRRAVVETIGGHPRLLEFANALLRGGRGNLKEVATRLRRLAGTDVKPSARRTPEEALRDAVLLASRDILLDELWATLGAEQRELLLQASVSRRPQSLADLAVSRWGASPDGVQQADVVADAERLIDLTLLSVAAGEEVVAHPWIADALAARHGDGLGERHRRAGAMRLARLQAGPVKFDDLVEICRHFAGADQDDELVQFALDVITPLEQRRGKLSLAAFLGEILPLVPPQHGGYRVLAEQELYALMNTGSIQAASQRCEAMLAAARQRVAADPDSDSARRSLAVSHERMAELRMLLGDAPQAERHLRDSLVIAQRRVAADPDNSEAQRFISVTYQKVGDLLLRLGDSAQAERYYRDSLLIARRLAIADPGNAQAQRDLSVSYEKLGDVLLRLGDGAQAERHYRDSHDIAERLATADPGNDEAQRDLFISHAKLGDLMLRLGNDAKAEREYRDSHDIAGRLATADPGDSQAQRDLSVSHERLGSVMLRLGGDAQAERHYRESLIIREQLATADPANAQAQRDLSVSNDNLGDLLLRLGDDVQAERHYRDSHAIREQLATTDPDNAQAQRDLSGSYTKLGDLLLRLGDDAQAERHYRASHAIREQLATADPTNTQGQQDLVASHVKLGDRLAQTGDDEHARRHYGEALAIVERLSGPDHPLAQELRDKLEHPGGDGAEPSAPPEPKQPS